MSDAIKKLAASELPRLGEDFQRAIESNQLGGKVLYELQTIRGELGAIRRLLEKQLDGEPKAAKPKSSGRKRSEDDDDDWWRGKDRGLTREESEAAWTPRAR
ncbi:MAG TPA: hypothetical protein VFW94_06965 [Candidatus Acidoferrales bacterium]|nr:hypothetical protein [Candidatus Acidoferrales bacterium]